MKYKAKASKSHRSLRSQATIKNIVATIGSALFISWFYGICSHIIIPLPFNLVPLSIQPLPVYLLALFMGYPAVFGYILYLIQGACGAPFFAPNIQLFGFARLIGPTGGYLFGFLFAGLFLAAVRTYKRNSTALFLVKIMAANVITFSCGLMQLSLFVPAGSLLAAGLFPFIIGDFIIKPALLIAARTGLAQLITSIKTR